MNALREGTSFSPLARKHNQRCNKIIIKRVIPLHFVPCALCLWGARGCTSLRCVREKNSGKSRQRDRSSTTSSRRENLLAPDTDRAAVARRSIEQGWQPLTSLLLGAHQLSPCRIEENERASEHASEQTWACLASHRSTLLRMLLFVPLASS
jgi:hypothetical protein